MRRWLITAFLLALSASGIAADVKPPAEHAKVLAELNEVLNRYPDAAKRFTIYDREAAKKAGAKLPVPAACIPSCAHICPGSDGNYCCSCGIDLNDVIQ